MYGHYLAIFTFIIIFTLINASSIARHTEKEIHEKTSCLESCTASKKTKVKKHCCKKSLRNTLQTIHKGCWGPLRNIPVGRICQTYPNPPFQKFVSWNTTFDGLLDMIITKICCSKYIYEWDFTIPEVTIQGVHKGSVDLPFKIISCNVTGCASVALDTDNCVRVAYADIAVTLTNINMVPGNPKAYKLTNQFENSRGVLEGTAELIGNLMSEIICSKFNIAFSEDNCSF